MKKGAMVPVLTVTGQPFLAGGTCRQEVVRWLRQRVALFLRRFGAWVLLRGTFGALVSEYFSNTCF
jgi:hypothetical protein